MLLFDARYGNFNTHALLSRIWVYNQYYYVLKDKYDFFVYKAVRLSFGLICDQTNETRCVPISYADQTVHTYTFIKSNIIAFVLPDLCIRCPQKEIWVLLGTHSALMLSFMVCFMKNFRFFSIFVCKVPLVLFIK